MVVRICSHVVIEQCNICQNGGVFFTDYVTTLFQNFFLQLTLPSSKCLLEVLVQVGQQRERPMRHWKLLCLQIGQSTLTVVQRTQHVIMSVSCVMRLRVLSLQPQDRVFYYNASTRVSSWWWSQHPLIISDSAIASIVLLQMKLSGHTHWSMCIERHTRPLSVPGTQWLRSWWISEYPTIGTRSCRCGCSGSKLYHVYTGSLTPESQTKMLFGNSSQCVILLNFCRRERMLCQSYNKKCDKWTRCSSDRNLLLKTGGD